jgi:aminomethyltransferase
VTTEAGGASETLATTPLTAWHEAHGAKMAPFGGYRMPVEYAGILAEHRAAREAAAVFDVSHMTEFWVEGAGAAQALDRIVTNWPGRLAPGRALYTPMCQEDGGTVDDLLVYRLGEERWLVVANAGNHAGDWEWLTQQAGGAGHWRDATAAIGLLAVQGPQAPAVLARVGVDPAVLSLASYQAAADAPVAGRRALLVSRTGYTGEDGFEIYVRADDTLPVWEALLAAGAVPAGLGARDTLRLEARLPLYGHELSRTITPLEAGLGAFVKWEKPGGFIGREALLAQRQAGLTRRLAGLYVDAGIARDGAPVGLGDTVGGVVTSGTFSPTLRRAIALALVPPAWAAEGTELWCAVRGRRLPARVVRLPFYRRPAIPAGGASGPGGPAVSQTIAEKAGD